MSRVFAGHTSSPGDSNAPLRLRITALLEQAQVQTGKAKRSINKMTPISFSIPVIYFLPSYPGGNGAHLDRWLIKLCPSPFIKGNLVVNLNISLLLHVRSVGGS